MALALSALGAGQPALAGGPLDALFDRAQQRRKPLPRQTSSYADPYISPGNAARRAAPSTGGRHAAPTGGGHRTAPSGGAGGSSGHGLAFCVRTCDGRYFPMQRHAGASPVEACRSFCPAAKTVVLTGSKIESAVAQNGTRYADLNTAFVYRKKVVADCTCNGKDEFGIARVGAETDPTLRLGDIVATNKGLGAYAGKSAAITPINPASSEWARRLTETKVRPAPSQGTSQAMAETTASVPDDVKPAKLKNEVKPEKDAMSAKSSKDVQPAKPSKESQPAKPVKEAKPAKPAKEAKPAKPVKEAKSAKPAKEAKPEKLAKGIKPAKLANETKPAKPAKQVKPAKPATEVKTAKLWRRAAR